MHYPNSYSSDAIHGAIALHDGEKVIGAYFCKNFVMWGDYVDAYGIKAEMDLGEGKTLDMVWIPAGNAKFKKALPLSCLFNATKSLTQNMYGMCLDDDDRKFFEEHPLASESGVALPDTLRVVQEIIEPYDIRIARVHLMPGTPINGDLLQWTEVLGMNPIGFGDMQTSNDIFAQMVNLPLEEVNKLYRMQYTEEKIRPAILCAVAPMKEDSKTGENLGHAEYVGFRAKREGYEPTMQVQLARKDQVQWLKEPSFPDVSAQAPTELDIYNSLGPDGKPMYAYKRKYSGPLAGSSTHGASGLNARARELPQATGYVGDRFDCYVCGGREERKNRVGANLCMKCWHMNWRQWYCGTCESMLHGCVLRGLRPVKGKNLDGDWLFVVDCPKCHDENELRVIRNSSDRKMQAMYKVSAALRGVKVVYT